MNRAIVTRKTLDALIRAKVTSLGACASVEALPVTWSPDCNGRGGCNWQIPGWVGDARLVGECLEKIEHYLEFLREQFDIPAQDTAD